MPANCTRHMVGSKAYLNDECPICKLEVELAGVFNTDIGRSMPRYRYYEVKASKGKSRRTFEWTTEKSLGFGGKEPEKYWAIERRWLKVKGSERSKEIRVVGFAQRNKAKARALKWYNDART